jgi:aarF domain-containing kinase
MHEWTSSNKSIDKTFALVNHRRMAACACRLGWRLTLHQASYPRPAALAALRFPPPARHRLASTVTSSAPPPSSTARLPGRRKKRRRPARSSLVAVGVLVALGIGAYNFVEPFRHFTIAVQRCTRVGFAVFGCIIDYKLLFRKAWPGEDDPAAANYREAREARHQAYSDCHRRCAERILAVLKRNGGIYVKLGQHLSSVQLIPLEWSSTMRPLQDQCQPTPIDDLAEMFAHETGASLFETFSDFDPVPLGVASLAQVHRATDRKTGKRVAVKIMHPGLEEFAAVDMKTATVMLDFVKRVFPTFEFTWLGEETQENLPKEMNFGASAWTRAAGGRRRRRAQSSRRRTRCGAEPILRTTDIRRSSSLMSVLAGSPPARKD